STQLNLSLIASQLGQITQGEQESSPSVDVLNRLEQICALHHPMPAIDLHKLTLTNRGRDDLRLGLLLASEHFDVLIPAEDSSLLVAADLQKLLHLFAQERQHLDYAVRDLVARQSDIRTS